MKHKRPVNLNLTTIHFPSHAIASILHRISGVVLLLFIPTFLWILDKSLASEESFNELLLRLHNPWLKLISWAALSALIFHLLAGIRHLLMDMGIAESLAMGRLTAKLIIALAVLLSILLGVWLWL